MNHPQRLESWRLNWRVLAPRDGTSLTLLHTAWLAHVPFENVTKREAAAPRPPRDFWRDHDERGAGGTCFDASVACHEMLTALGFKARLLFCGLPQVGPTAHAAVLVELADGPWLMDVAYALPAPVRLPDTGSTRLASPWYDVEVMRGPEGELLLFTTDVRGRRFRYQFSERPPGRANFNAAWRATCAPGARYMLGLALGRSFTDHRLIFRAPNTIYRLGREHQAIELLPHVTPALLAARFKVPETLVAAGLATPAGALPPPPAQ